MYCVEEIVLARGGISGIESVESMRGLKVISNYCCHLRVAHVRSDEGGKDVE